VLGCANNSIMPFMSGAGVNSVLLMYNRTVYHQFSDKDQNVWLDVALQSHKISPLCSGSTGAKPISAEPSQQPTPTP